MNNQNEEAKLKTELGADIYELLEKMQEKHGIEKTAGALLTVAMTTIQEIYGTDFLFNYYRGLLEKLHGMGQPKH